LSFVRDLQRALELAHYASRHRGRLHVAVLETGLRVSDFLLDLKLLAAYGLDAIVVAVEDDGARARLDEARREGVRLAIIDDRAGDPAPSRAAVEARETAVVLVPADPVERAAALAMALGARRLLLLAVDPARTARGRPRPHLTAAEARSAGAHAALAARLVDGGVPGVVLLDAAPGVLFEELFTHHGAGVLIGDALPEAIRPADFHDVADVYLLLQAEMGRGHMLPVDERAVARTIHEHLVHTIDGLVVGTARLAPCGDWAELSRFAARPRYRGRGRARALGEALIARGADLGFAHLFALSVDPRMWAFFESLGFEACPREVLPERWRTGYDFARPSRGFRRTFDPDRPRREEEETTGPIRRAEISDMPSS